jgi:hypothetical protein
LVLSKAAGSSEKEDLLKTTELPVNSSGRVYVVPIAKEDASTEKCSFYAELAKPADAKYLSVSDVKRDSSGNLSFVITGVSANNDKTQPARVKVVVTCVESGKKANLTVVVTNPVLSVGVAIGAGDLDKKKDTIKVALDINSAAGTEIKTTDKLKLFVSSGDITYDGKRVSVERGSTVKAKMNKAGTEFTLTASKDAGTAAKIGLLVTNTVTKKSKLYLLVQVDDKGSVSSLTH